MRGIRSVAAVAIVCLAATLVGCGSTTGAGTSVTPATNTRDIRIQFQAPWFPENQLCTFDAAQQIEDGPFNNGQDMTLENEAGTLLARGSIKSAGKVDQDTCAMDAIFKDVPKGSANYVVVSTIGTKWRFLESEVNANPVVVDFFKNPGS
jgi:hypothetical protein